MLTPLGIYSIAMRTGFFTACDCARAVEGIIASNQGRPRLTPAPRSSVLREIFIGQSSVFDFCLLTASRPHGGGRLILKRPAQHNQLDQFLDPIIIVSQLAYNPVHRTGILLRESAAQGVSQHLRCEVAYKKVLM